METIKEKRKFLTPIILGVASILLFLLASQTLAQQGTFVATGSMNEPRAYHTATFLNDGTVLIAGGFNESGSVISAEIYNPATGIFTPTTGNMTMPRHNGVYVVSFTATLLNNGKVLITGGTSTAGNYNHYTGSTELASAELYDPATGIFTATAGNMTATRSGHTATLLRDGTVLIVGGMGWSDISGYSFYTAELYDPVTDSFSLLSGTTSQMRWLHTATLLNDERVLMVTGISYGADSAEVYDPSTDTFGPLSSLVCPRGMNTATLLNSGQILITGGYCACLNPISGMYEGWYASVEIYDPATNTFSRINDMNVWRVWHAATLLKTGEVLITGGWNSVAPADLYDPATGTFALTGVMVEGRTNHTATLLNNGQVLVAGGQSVFSYFNPIGLSSAELYIPANQPPVALCQDVTVAADSSCTASASIDNGSYDPDGDTITLSQSPSGPYSLGATSVTLTVTDDEGTTGTCTGMVTVVDTLPPTINISTCPGEGYLGGIASVNVDVTDSCSGVSSQSVPNGSNLLDTSTAGTKTFTVSAVDNAGNDSSNACTYNVIYDFLGAGGFRPPINNPPVLNTAKAGSTIPVKWQLPDGHGGFISDLGAITSIRFQQVNCSNISTTLTDPVETTATGGTGLRYDFTANQYIYNWQTSKSWAGNCYVLLLKLNDGKQYLANFTLK
jgi:hypothetical protein